MAILVDPLFADEARGQLAKVLVFKRGAIHPNVSPCFYHPVNWTPAKIAQASYFRSLCSSWKQLSPEDKSNWSSIAPGVLTAFNYYIKLAGVLPTPEEYLPPSGDNILFNFIFLPYSPPSGGNIHFIF